jgi:peroxiredoxin Q/BCP
MTALAVGDPAPDFDLETDGGGRIRLSGLAGRTRVVYFYPADDTETCTREAVEFTAAAPDFAAAGAMIIGISPDPPKSHERFKAKYGLGIVLASDPGHAVAERYGTWVEKTMFGRRYMGVERATFVIGPRGAISRIWRKVRIKGHVQDVLSTVRTL